MFKRWGLISLVALSVMSSAQAQQTLFAKEGNTLHARLSSKSLNKIAIQGDRIVGVKGNPGDFELDKDLALGHIFIKPLIEKSDPISIFVSTEKGHSYNLHFSIADIDAQNIVLIQPQALTVPPSGYETALKTLITAMHTQNVIAGFVIENLHYKHPDVQGAKVVALQSYTGDSFVAEVLEVHNTTKEALLFTELDFYHTGVRAIALLNPLIAAGAKTRVYRVL